MPRGLPTLIGSLPAATHREAMDWILAATAEIPLWPQLPALPRERMLNQFVEGLPGIVESEERTYFDTTTESFRSEQLAFYEEYLKVSESPGELNVSRFKTSRERAAGLYLLTTTAWTLAERTLLLS